MALPEVVSSDEWLINQGQQLEPGRTLAQARVLGVTTELRLSRTASTGSHASTETSSKAPCMNALTRRRRHLGL
jgi:hypothetical protein